VQSAREWKAALVRIASWNLQHGVPDPVGPPALERAVPGLRSLEADVYALQELDRRRLRTRFVNQAAVLGEALGGQVLWARAKQALWGAQGNALIVCGEVLEFDVVDLPGDGERRVAAVASIGVAGRRYSVATAHLALDPAVARRQLRTALGALAERPKPWVLAGDLNLLPAQVARLAEAAGYDLVEGPFTVNARTRPNRRLDHVLCNGVVETDSGTTKLPCSDHLAVWADVS
jgi:endonuclease/exonuclease/phosphatase family metal-dependent hydrolase